MNTFIRQMAENRQNNYKLQTEIKKDKKGKRQVH